MVMDSRPGPFSEVFPVPASSTKKRPSSKSRSGPADIFWDNLLFQNLYPSLNCFTYLKFLGASFPVLHYRSSQIGVAHQKFYSFKDFWNISSFEKIKFGFFYVLKRNIRRQNCWNSSHPSIVKFRCRLSIERELCAIPHVRCPRFGRSHGHNAINLPVIIPHFSRNHDPVETKLTDPMRQRISFLDELLRVAHKTNIFKSSTPFWIPCDQSGLRPVIYKR